MRGDQVRNRFLKAREVRRRRPTSERGGVAFAAGFSQGGAEVGSAKVEAQRGGHPLIPELTMLSTKKRCRNAKRTRGGRTAIVEPAMTRFVFMAPRL